MDRRQIAVVRTAKIASLVVSSLLLLSGFILTIWSEELAVTLRYLIGIECFLIGVAKIFGYFSNDLYRIAYQFDLAGGGIVFIFGILLFAVPEAVMPHLSSVVAIYVIIDGLFRVQTAVDAKLFGMSHWYIVLIGAAILVAGSLSIYLFVLENHRIIWMGVMLMADALLSMMVTMYTVRVRVRKQNKESDFGMEGTEE